MATLADGNYIVTRAAIVAVLHGDVECSVCGEQAEVVLEMGVVGFDELVPHSSCRDCVRAFLDSILDHGVVNEGGSWPWDGP